MLELRDVQVSLKFLEDGLHAYLTIDRAPAIPRPQGSSRGPNASPGIVPAQARRPPDDDRRLPSVRR